MGLGYSKAHPKVTKVAPLQNKEEEISSTDTGNLTVNQSLETKDPYFFTRLRDRNSASKGQLPPLRETWYGRYSAVPRTMYFDIPLEQGETSIIKRHPPRRLQKLEPIGLPHTITSGRSLHHRESGRTKGLEKKMQIPMYTSGKRQYLHKMQMLEMNRKRQEAQEDLKKSLQREARINKQKLRDHKAKKILQKSPRNDDDNLLTLLPDETVDRSLGNSQNAEFWDLPAKHDYSPQKTGKMETWFREQEARGQLLWDSSSSDSDDLGKNEKKSRALVRTRTERIPLFDEFFDRD
ncbi:uncharacterized protein CCDC198 isoform X2 [Sorex araneus]|uniref:uncharacterized protein CCDC198 isoform X2 n=1 Tax=Sorex araneus TaxID=42254 RepID=UPI002433B6A6|nr:uncharacterized protein CCDC198 isoform X2 [Sorex araneus]